MVALADGRSVGAASTVQRNIIYITVFCISLFREGPYSVFQICGNPCIPRIPYSSKIPVEYCQGLWHREGARHLGLDGGDDARQPRSPVQQRIERTVR